MQSAETTPAEQLMQLKRPLVIGHRGLSQLAPENTFPSFALAKAAGADMVELDYHHSKDGALIVVHDFDLDRTTDAIDRWGGKKIRVASKTVDELKSLDAGKWFDARFAGTRLPLLTEALDLIQKDNVTLIERKAGDAKSCVDLLQERKLINQVIVQSFDWSYLKAFHDLEPLQVLGALGPPGHDRGKELTDAEKALSQEWIDRARQTGARAVVWNKLVDSGAVDYAHRQGLKVITYTINDPELANQLLDVGVDGLITDNTALIWRTIALRASAPSTRK